MNKIFTSRISLGITLFGLGYLIAWITLTPGSRQVVDDSPSLDGSRAGAGAQRLQSSRPSGTSQSELRREELAEHWENADMDFIVEKMDSIKTFESNTYDTGLSQELCDYLAISRNENATIDRAIRSAVEQFQELQASSIEMTQVDDTTSKFLIKKFPDEGGNLKESLQETIRETLGENRSFLFSKIARGSMGHAFLDFGESDVHITMTTSGPPGDQQYVTMVSSGIGSRRFETKGVPLELMYLLKIK
jgi:hypothetical protein